VEETLNHPFPAQAAAARTALDRATRTATGDARAVLRGFESDLLRTNAAGRVPLFAFRRWLDAFGVKLDESAAFQLGRRLARGGDDVDLDALAQLVDGDDGCADCYLRACAAVGAEARPSLARRLPCEFLAMNDGSLGARDAEAVALAARAASPHTRPSQMDLGGNLRIGDDGVEALGRALLDERGACCVGALDLSASPRRLWCNSKGGALRAPPPPLRPQAAAVSGAEERRPSRG
jgi:hypothetical protein